jgi:hypothetical protein
MTAPLRNTLYSAVPASQNTAPVAEFRCLYTNDLRRKQKRWQDGYLKFHSFNSRIMVYDQSRAFLGDTYWKESGAVQEGDELTLDKGVMVEVAEAMGITQTDLNPLFDKKPKDPPPPSTAPPPPRRFNPPSQVAPSNAARPTTQMRHKSLNALLGNPKGPLGKALPIISPYEARKEQENEARRDQEHTTRREQENEWAVDREAKRQKTVHNPAKQRQASAEKVLLPTLSATKKPHRPIPRGATVISLDCEPDTNVHISSDITLPSTPPFGEGPTLSRPMTTAPAVQTPKPRIPRGKVPVPSVKALETPKQPPPPSSPPVSASNRLSNVDFAVSVEKPKPQPQPRRDLAQHQPRESVQMEAREPIKERAKEPGRARVRQTEQAQAKNLAQARTSEPAQDHTRPSLPPASPPRNPKAKSLRLSTGVKRNKLMCQAPPPEWGREASVSRVTAPKAKGLTSHDKVVSTGSGRESGTKERITGDPDVTVSKRKRGEATAVGGDASKRSKTARTLADIVQDESDDPDVLGMLDEQLLVSAAPAIQETAVAKAAHKGNRTAKSNSATTRQPSPHGDRRKTPLENTTKTRPSREESEPVLPPHPHSRPTSPRASTPPRKPAFSTGGFPKKQQPKPPSIPAATLASNSAPKPGSPPTMSTTELAALLATSISSPSASKPKSAKSTPRSFRRVRSENDAPIPSTADEWEQQNLPKTDAPATAVTTTTTAATAATAAASMSMATSSVPVTPRLPGGGGLSALVKRTDPRRKMGRAASLNVNIDGGGGCGEEEQVQSPVADTDVGPWSTEAFDLFDWRRPADAGASTGAV